MAGEEPAGVERQRRRHRLELSRVHHIDGGDQSASGAEGGGSAKPDGRRLDGRRLVPQRRVSRELTRLPGGPGYQQGQGRRRLRARRGRPLHAVPRSRIDGGLRQDVRHRALPRRPQVPRQPGVHRVLVAAGGRQVARGAAAQGADAARGRAVGPGRQLRRARGVPRDGAQRQEQRHGLRCTSGRGGIPAPTITGTIWAR